MNVKILSAAVAAVALTASAEVAIKDGETIAFMGDSITYAGETCPNGYIHLVMKGLEVAGVKDAKKIPAGISGNKSSSMLARLDRDVLARRDGRRAQWMTLSCGVNDVWHQDWGSGVALEDYKANVTKILDTCAASNVTVVVLTATMFEKGTNYATFAHNVKVAPYNEWLRAEAKRRGLRLADLNKTMWDGHAVDPKVRYTCDGVHMQWAGQKMMAWGILTTLGIPASKKSEIFAAWEEIPGQYSISAPLNKREHEELQKKIKASGLNESDYVRKQLNLK